MPSVLNVAASFLAWTLAKCLMLWCWLMSYWLTGCLVPPRTESQQDPPMMDLPLYPKEEESNE
jgi:hypothetical protein